MIITVIGAGVFGGWSAWHLAQAGHRVTLIDAFGAGNGRGSSADHSRVIRAGYGGDAIYSRWAMESLRDWKWLAEKTRRKLHTTTGALFMGEPDNAYIKATFRTLSGLGYSVEWLEPDAIAHRFPQISTAGLGPAIYEPEAGALRAREGVQAIVQLALTRGVAYQTARIAPLNEDASAAAVRLAGGAVCRADAYVFACGPWLPKMFPETIGNRIRATRQEVLYFGVPAGDTRFSAPQLPVWIDFAAGVYGVPDIDARGFKVGIDKHGRAIDPDTSDRLLDLAILDTTRAWLAKRFPRLAGAPLVDGRVCQYENTSTGDFIIDRHPRWRNVWIVGGGSGHGFKHGPAVGRYVAAVVADQVTPESRFGLAAKDTRAARAVY